MSDTIFGNLKSFKSDEKCFLFHVKSSFRSQVFKFLSRVSGMQENVLIRKIRLISKSMTSQPG